MANVVARWSGEKVRFDVRSGSGHSVVVDGGKDLGDNQGMRPTEMLLGALATCTGFNAVMLLQKFRQPFTTLSVEVEGEQAPDWPKQFTSIRITFVIAWEREPDQKLVDKALDLACNRYCPVDTTLAQGTRIEVAQREPVG
jgi:putative redox protein